MKKRVKSAGREGQVHLNKDEQLVVAIEHLALGLEYVIRQRKLSVGELVHWHEEMRTRDFNEKTEWGLERKYANYRKIFAHFSLPVVIDWQMRIVQGWDKPHVFRQLVLIYLRHAAWGYNDAAAELLIRNTCLSAHLLFALVQLRFSIMNGLPVRFKYRKFFLMRETDRKVIPLSLLADGQQFYLVACEVGSDKPKQFMLSRIVSMQGDLHTIFHRSSDKHARIPFDPQEFLKSEHAHFNRPLVPYRIWMFGNTYDHFRHTSSLQYSIVEGPPKRCLVEVMARDQDEILQLVFRYAGWCRLESPAEAVETLRQRLELLCSVYD